MQLFHVLTDFDLTGRIKGRKEEKKREKYAIPIASQKCCIIKTRIKHAKKLTDVFYVKENAISRLRMSWHISSWGEINIWKFGVFLFSLYPPDDKGMKMEVWPPKRNFFPLGLAIQSSRDFLSLTMPDHRARREKEHLFEKRSKRYKKI